MRISAVTIRNFRCLRDVTIELDNYAAFIGANGAGKSSVLYALDWFFNNTSISESDVHGYMEGEALEPGSAIEVAVTFTDLSAFDREKLQQYGRGERAEVRRTWYADTKQTKTVGNARQGQGFSTVRADQGIATRRASYRDLRNVHTDLPELPGNASKDAIFEALLAWESDPTHADWLVEVLDSDANQMMGWNGSNVLRECIRFVLVPAATSIAEQVGTSSRGTALTELVGAFLSGASQRAQAAWLAKHADAVHELASDIGRSIGAATDVQAGRINARLSAFIPNAIVSLTPTVPEFVPKIDPSIMTKVTIGGVTNDISRQGHGVQRAVLISMFQALVPDEDLTRQMHEARDDEDETAAQARLDGALDRLPSVVVAVEEPEIYQHPIRARYFARALVEFSQQPGIQVILATHSPYFILPAQFDALRRFTYTSGFTSVARASVQSVSALSGIDEVKVEKAIAADVPTEFSEGFFADAVVLVEGRTDRVVIEGIASKLGQDLDRLGISVISVQGKSGLRVARAILSSLGVPTYLLADGDFEAADRKVYRDKSASEIESGRIQAHGSNRAATQTLVGALPSDSRVICGNLPYTFGDPTVVCADFGVWRDDIESELEEWPSFVHSLGSSGVELAARSNKNLLAYRNAAVDADVSDLPTVLVAVMSEIVKLGGGEWLV